MKFKIEIHPDAAFELQDSFNWYESRSEGLGLRFISAVEKTIKY